MTPTLLFTESTKNTPVSMLRLADPRVMSDGLAVIRPLTKDTLPVTPKVLPITIPP